MKEAGLEFVSSDVSQPRWFILVVAKPKR
jgi:hypothetical protein